MATVYRAHDRKHDTTVALKLLRPDLAEIVGPARFDREIRITAQLQHPNVVPILDSGVHETVPYYVMPFVHGESLAARLRREGVLGVTESVRITRQVAKALSYAHKLGFVHRDVKPANILLQDGEVLLADFGVARAATTQGGDSITESGIALGTAQYMSPEQSAGGTVDHRADQYSLACVLYELLAGAPPFTGPAQMVVARHQVDEAPALHNVRRELPEGVERAVRRALSKVAGDRFDTIDGFAAALDAGLSTPVTHEIHVRRQRRRTRLALGAVGVIAAAALATWLAGRDGEPLDPNRVMVFPLVVPAGFSGPSSAGEDAATMIGSALDGTDPLRWSDGWSHLSPVQRDDMRSVALGELTRIAAARRCAWALVGRIVPRGDSTSVALELYDVATGQRAAEKTAGTAAEPWRAALQAVGSLLPTLVPSGARPGTHDLAREFERRPPAAIASFLLGEAQFRRVQPDAAFAHYERAVRADSTFALAALRAAQAASWRHRPSDAAAMIALTRGASLPARYAAFADGFRQYLAGDADSAAAAFRTAISLDPEMVEAWTQLGEVYTHLLPTAGDPDSLASIALGEARRLDPAAKGPLLHLIEIGVRARRPGVDALVTEFLAADPDTVLGHQVRIMQACASAGPSGVDWEREAVVAPLPLLLGAIQLGGGGSRIDCAEPAFRAILAVDTSATDDANNRRFYSMLNLQSVLISRGRGAEARDELERFVARWGSGSSLFLLAAPHDAAYRARAAEVARADAERSRPDYRRMGNAERLWQLGVVEASLGDTAAARRIERELSRRDATSRRRSITAHLAIRAADTTRALALLDSLVPSVATSIDLSWDTSAPMAGERLLFARLLAARAQGERAIAIADVLDGASPVVHLLLVRESLEFREATANAIGRPQWASRFRQRLDALATGRPAVP